MTKASELTCITEYPVAAEAGDAGEWEGHTADQQVAQGEVDEKDVVAPPSFGRPVGEQKTHTSYWKTNIRNNSTYLP